IDLKAVVLREKRLHNLIVAFRIDWRLNASVEIVRAERRYAVADDGFSRGISFEWNGVKRPLERIDDERDDHGASRIGQHGLGQRLKLVSERCNDLAIFIIR